MVQQTVSPNMRMRNFEYFNPKYSDISKYHILDMEPADSNEPVVITDYHDVNMNVIRALKDIVGQVYWGGYPLRMGKNTPVEVRFYHRLKSDSIIGIVIRTARLSVVRK